MPLIEVILVTCAGFTMRSACVTPVMLVRLVIDDVGTTPRPTLIEPDIVVNEITG